MPLKNLIFRPRLSQCHPSVSVNVNDLLKAWFNVCDGMSAATETDRNKIPAFSESSFSPPLSIYMILDESIQNTYWRYRSAVRQKCQQSLYGDNLGDLVVDTGTGEMFPLVVVDDQEDAN